MRRSLTLTMPAVLAGVLLSACGGSGKPAASKAGLTSSTASAVSTANTATGVTGSAVAPGMVSAAAGGVTASLHASTHRPRVNVGWPISFTVTRAGRPLRARVSYEYLFAGNVVAKRSHYHFTGRFSDVFRWPASAVGYPLTFRAVIAAGGQTLLLDYPVQVAR